MKKYIVLATGLDNSKTGQHFAKGDTVLSSDFTRAAIRNWLEIGALKEITKKDSSDGER